MIINSLLINEKVKSIMMGHSYTRSTLEAGGWLKSSRRSGLQSESFYENEGLLGY